MSKRMSPPQWMVVWNGVPFRRGLTKPEAERIAERWQGSHAKNKGLLKHKDRGDWIEIKRDPASERDFDERYDVMKRGGRQRVIMEHQSDDEGGSHG